MPDDTTVALSLTLSDQTGEVRGFVVTGDHPIDGVLAVLVSMRAPDETTGKGARFRAFQTESDGSFDFRSVPAGRYQLFAVVDTEFEYARPEAVAPYLAASKEIEVRAHAASDETVPLGTAAAR